MPAAILVAEGVDLGIAVRDVQQGTALLGEARDNLGTSPEQWTPGRVAAAGRLQARAQPLIVAGCTRLHNDPGLGLAGRLPVLGDQARAALDLCDAAVAAGGAFADFVKVGTAYLGEAKDQKPPGRRLLSLLAETQVPLADAESRLGPALRRLDEDQKLALVAPLKSRLHIAAAQLRPAEAQAATSSVAARFLPSALGAQQPMTYLVLLENPSEIRPSGGLIGSAGTVTFDQGSPTQLDLHDYDALNPLFKERLPVPSPLDRYLEFYKNSLELGDAGWDPDFPTTARLTEAMYKSAVPSDLQGTLSVDPYAVAALLKVTGPVDVPGYGTFTSDDFFAKLNNIVNARIDTAVGKQALPAVAQEVLKQVLAQPVSSWPALLSVIQQQAINRHVQIYMHDAGAQQALVAARYDGSTLTAASDDYLMLIDANVGGTKGDWFAHKTLDLKTEVYAGGLSRHELQVTYQMPAAVDAADRLLNPGDGSYRDYVRFYLPEQASVASFQILLDGQPVATAPDRIYLEHGKQVVGGFFSVPRGHQAVIRLAYEVPLQESRQYTLYLQKQAGVLDLPTTISVSYPGGSDRRTTGLERDQVLSYRW